MMKKQAEPGRETGARRLAVLSLAALGIVFGDIGTSPLYAIRECFHGDYGIEASAPNVLGVLSLIVWSLVAIVTVKYLTFILRADNGGEGGIIALLAQLDSNRRLTGNKRTVLLMVGLFGATLLYGDGMITPSISVLSAVEGLKLSAPILEPWVIPITLAILIALFLLQHRGTRRIGAVFGPVIVFWFLTLALLGLRGILTNPGVLAALDPRYGARLLLGNHPHGFLVLGAVFLVVTGAEALFADMGHFGKRPIRLCWYVLVLPSLLLNYFGQGALLLGSPEASHHPFYNLVPDWARYPMVLLATLATIIASQAVISGVFSMTRQAIQLGYLPRLRVVHTSHEKIGQIYIPEVNWLLMVATVTLVIAFQKTSRLAAAYGVAVTATMIISAVLFYFVARERWNWSRLSAGVPFAAFLIVDLSFFSANITKVVHGAWFPLVIGLAAYTVMSTWRKGRSILAKKIASDSLSLDKFLASLGDDPPIRVPGRAVFLTGNLDIVPPALLNNIKHNRVLHETVIIATVLGDAVPTVPAEKRVVVVERDHGVYQVKIHYGFMQSPHVPRALALTNKEGLPFEMEGTSFFLGRERLLPGNGRGMPRWRQSLFAFLSRNALGATVFFRIPTGRVIEVGEQVEL